MINKGTKLYSILNQKCPKCQEGNMFKYPTLHPKFAVMHDHCPKCGYDFIQEPSFYFGAMYFSYAIQVAVIVAVYLLLRFTLNPDVWTSIIWMIVAVVLILPLNFRWSRLAWLNLFASYKKNLSI